MKNTLKAFNKTECKFLSLGKRIISLFFLSFLFSTAIYGAQDIKSSDISFEDQRTSGYIVIKIPIYDDDGYDEYLKSSGSYLKIKVGSQEYICMEFYSQDQRTDPWYWANLKLVYGHCAEANHTRNNKGWTRINTTNTRIEVNKSGTKATAEIRYYIPGEWMGQELYATVFLNVAKNGGPAYPDYTVSKTHTFSPNQNYTTPSISYALSASNAGHYTVTGTASTVGSSKRYYGMGNNAGTQFEGSSFTYDIPVEDTNRNITTSVKYEIVNSSSGCSNQSKTVSTTTSITGYPLPTGMQATLEHGGKVKLTWDMATGGNQEGGFDIQRADNPEFNNATTVVSGLSIGSGSTKEYIDDVSDKNLNGTYHYRIRRTNNAWQWSLYASTSVGINMKHKAVEKAEVELVGTNSIITWELSDSTDGIWSRNSKIYINRVNLTEGGSKVLIIVPDDSLSVSGNCGKYTDELFLMCNKYRYEVHVQPGESAYQKEDAVSTETVIPTEMGSLETTNASVGYFSDRVEIEWTSDGYAINEFIILRREYGTTTEFKQIAKVEGSVASTYYTYDDTYSVPGVIYEYQIKGLTKCADEIIYSNSLTTKGFRTPTGDIYGRVTYSNGQAVENVEVNVSTEEYIDERSLEFTQSAIATVDNKHLLEGNVDSVTLQVWFSPARTTGTQKLISKSDMYELGIENDEFYFMAGSEKISPAGLKVSDVKNTYGFMHLTGTMTTDSIAIYVNGDLTAQKKITSTFSGNDNEVVFGGNFEGYMDEIRIWGRALSAYEVKRDYNRYLTGGEKNLLAYWTFNFATETEFYDISYEGVNHNQNHGKLNDVVLVSDSYKRPTIDQLGYRGVTLADGSYSIRAIPYKGNATPYYIVPRLGIHRFEPEMAVRSIALGSQSHTVDFIDNSSFSVKGWVTYENSTVPVEGVNFYIDGVMALESNGTPKATDAAGFFNIMVPVGTHEVKAQKPNHTFVNGGKITDQHGMDRNYQDSIYGVELTDNTLVKYIGRVAGGTIQESYPVGHSLSKNNLADGMEVTLTYSNNMYGFGKYDEDKDYKGTIEEWVPHFKPSNKEKAHSNKVIYGSTGANKNIITIYPNDTTGEFVAYVIPETFTVSVDVSGHGSIPGSGSTLNLTQQFNALTELYEYRDSVQIAADTWERYDYSDTVHYNMKQPFIKRYEPTVRISQLDVRGNVLPYYGTDTTYITNMLGEVDTVPLYVSDNNRYTFGQPVFMQYQNYDMLIEVFEEYIHHQNQTSDEVPTQDATVKFNNEIADSEGRDKEIEADENGIAYYSFAAGDPELTSGTRIMQATVTYGGDANPVSINWDNPEFDRGEAYLLGAHQNGTDFVTMGPDKVLMVLRDPPGSKSYSYLEKGVSFEESSAYTGSVKNAGHEDFTTGVKTNVTTFAGVGAGVINVAIENESGVSIGIVHEEQYEGQDTKKTKTTTTTRFQTSDDPLYVGADGDLYIGYSTNVSFGSTENITIVSKEKFEAAEGAYRNITDEEEDWIIVQSTGLNASQSFSTLFAYPQIHIEDRLIPEIESIRNSLLLQPGQYTIESLQQMANDNDTVFYVSYFTPDDEDYGKSNDDATIKDKTNGISDNVFDGPSYRIIYNENGSVSDSIVALNQSIANWVKQMAENEKQKVEAELLQNYSFHAGSQIEYSESYSTTKSHQSSFYIMIGGKVANDNMINIAGAQVKFEFEETVETQHGGTFTSEVEASHSKGFVLAEEGDDDYISVDVCREKGWKKGDEEYNTGGNGGMVGTGDVKEKDYYSTFIFKTKAGVTSCPYEGEYVTRYYEEGKHVINEATKRLEVPEIDMPVKFIQNVPSGETAKLTLYLRNNSEMDEDVYFDLSQIEASNPDGARLQIDGGAISNGRTFLVPAGETLIKTLEVGKGRVMNYEGLQLILHSQCQYDPTDFQENIADTVTFTVHFIPSCTDVNVRKPYDNWIYNTELPTENINGVDKRYMEILLDEFDVNYDNFHSIRLQYKAASDPDSDAGWVTLMNYFNDADLYEQAVDNGLNAEMIDAANAGTIPYRFFMDDLPDQYYDIRAVSVCVINNVEVLNESEIKSGIKDTYRPRLFGVPQPADGILSIDSEIRLNFNEKIAEGLLTRNDFQVRGVRNGSISDHNVSLHFDGQSDYMATEFEKNWIGKDITVEMWIQPDQTQNAVLFSHGNVNESIELMLTSSNQLQVRVGGNVITSTVIPYEQDSWAHVAFVYEASGHLTAYYNYQAVINRVSNAGDYTGIGKVVVGKSIAGDNNFYAGKMHNVRIWEKVVSSVNLQLNSLALLSGNEEGLMAYYPMEEGRGIICEDKARGASMIMNGCTWAMPDGYAVTTNGANYLQIEASSHAFTKEMDFTIEFWFKAEEGQQNVTMLSNGRGDGQDPGGSTYNFAIGFDNNQALYFLNNGNKNIIEGEYMDNNWHHFAFSIDRTIGRAQVYMDGELNTYIDAANIGGISSLHMYLGARGYYEDGSASSFKADQYFKGSFDDLRFWELYRTASVTAENNNVKLSGEELGLVHYYPFDTYITYQGLKYVEFTNEDMRIASGPNPETDYFTVIGTPEATVQSKDIAPLKDHGPVEDLEYDFVVNNDALIINLNEAEYRVAKTIVTFTVKNVRDINGNIIASPVTWSAYVDKNQLKWDEDRLSLEKDVYDELAFTARAVNNGGSVMRYTINNAPGWLDITPSSGTLSPKSYDEIRFVVNEGLNVGTYDEVIYLINEDNVAEALSLNLTVKGVKPDWSVNPKEFKYSMNVFGKMRFDNIFSADENDILAVFQDGKCVGITNSTYNKTLDMWYSLLTIYSNDIQHNNLEFRMWDASTGRTYHAVPDVSISFKNDVVIGDADSPVIFDGKEILFQDIILSEGWNWLSFNLDDENLSDVNKTLINGNWSTTDIVKSRDYFDSYSRTKGWTGTLSQRGGGFNNLEMFMLLSSRGQTLSISGSQIDTENTPLTVRGNQWNYIGYLPSVNTTVKEALAGYDAIAGDIIKSQNSFAMYSKNEWVGNLTYMEANRGYMLYRTAANDVTFTYPSVSALLSNTRRTLSASHNYINTRFAENMNMVATTEGLLPSDRILAYINGELRGIGTYENIEHKPMNFITVNANEEGVRVVFELERDGETIASSVTPVYYGANKIEGSVENPFYLDFSIPENNISVYPNPFRDNLYIEVMSENSGKAQVMVLDIAGRKIMQGENQMLSKGYNRIVLDGTSLATGIYIVQVNVDDTVTSYKVEKVNK